MTRLRQRCARLTVYGARPESTFVAEHPGFFDRIDNGIVIDKLRMQFRIERSLARDPNTCDIVITNLAPDTRGWLSRLPLAVILEAGYDDEFHLLFQGDIRRAYSNPRGADIETTLRCGDGSRAFAGGRVDRGYGSGVKAIQVLRDAARSMGMTLPRNIETSPDLQRPLSSGYTLAGRSRDELTRLLRRYGYTWSIQGGKLQALRDDEVRPGLTFEVSQEKGMVGSPQLSTADNDKKPPKVTVTNLLYPQIIPGVRVSVISEETRGDFRVEKVRHEGDTSATGNYQTEIEVKPI